MFKWNLIMLGVRCYGYGLNLLGYFVVEGTCENSECKQINFFPWRERIELFFAELSTRVIEAS